MLNRSLNPVLVRLAIVAATLALLACWLRPAVFADSHIEIDYAENGDEAVATFSADGRGRGHGRQRLVAWMVPTRRPLRH